MSMDEFGSERSKLGNIHTISSETSPSQTQAIINIQGQWKNIGTSMDAISFGFVATAILISMFLIMAIFEHLFKPTTPSSFSSPRNSRHISSLESGAIQKHASSRTEESTPYFSDYTVLMPGQEYPTFIAQPTPLPCRREGVYWPYHQHSF